MNSPLPRLARLCWLALFVSSALPLVLATRAAAQGPALSPADGDGIHVVSSRQLDARLFALSVTTPTLPKPVDLRILLPSGYASAPARRYPVLYLFDGTSGTAADWTTTGDAEQTTAGLPLIVVMPDITLDGDGGGWCTNWYNSGAYGLPEWETFHIDQLLPWVDANLRTVPDRQARAVAGLSQGGFCSMSYAARHPDLFSVALAYSGAPDIAGSADTEAGSTAIINATEVGLDHVPPNSMFGSRATEEVNWADHDPDTLAGNLRDTKLFMYFGNGVPGPLDPSPTTDPAAAGGAVGASGIEGMIFRDNVEFHQRLVSLGIPSTYVPYGNGTHSWPYWARDLRWSIGSIMDDFAHPLPDPQDVTYSVADPTYSVYGWTLSMHRPAMEFSTLEHASASGFALAGSGSGTVTTPPLFAPGGHYAVVLRGQGIDETLRLTADPKGRLTVLVPLGPGNPYQQDTAQAAAAGGTRVYTTVADIAPA